MSRPIKFRVWDKKYKRFWREIEPFHFILNNSDKHTTYESIDDFNEIVINLERFEIQQFTGLKDKNGREVYEGDIIQNSIDHPILFEIIYHKQHAAFKQRLINKDFPRIQPSSLEFMNIMRVFVVGNVFENPELLVNSKV